MVNQLLINNKCYLKISKVNNPYGDESISHIILVNVGLL